MVLEEIGKTVEVVAVTCPEQLSVAVGAEILGTAHVEVIGDKLATFAIGASLSPTSTICVWVEIFPEASVKVQVTVVFEVIGNTVFVVPVIEPEQLSVAVGAAILFTGEHDDVIADRDAFVGTGLTLSPTSTICVCVEIFPAASEKVHVTVVFDVIGNTVLVVPVIEPEQLSDAVGAVMVVTGEQTEVITGSDDKVGTGAVMSLTLTCCVWVVVLPFPSS